MNIKKALAARLRKWATALDPQPIDGSDHPSNYKPFVIQCRRHIDPSAPVDYVEQMKRDMRSELTAQLIMLYPDCIDFTEKQAGAAVLLTARLYLFTKKPKHLVLIKNNQLLNF